MFKRFKKGDEEKQKKQEREENQILKNPLDRAKEEGPILKEIELTTKMKNIIYENEIDEKKKNAVVEKEKLKGDLQFSNIPILSQTKFVDFQCLKGEEKNSRLIMTVRFEGKNVITGFQQCLEHGIITDTHLPPCLENVQKNPRSIYHW